MPKGTNQKFKLYRLAQIMLKETDEEHFAVNVDVYLSSQFLHWIFALGDGAKIVGPPEVVEEAKKEIRRLAEQYR